MCVVTHSHTQVPEGYEKEARDYFAVGVYVFFQDDWYFSCDVGTAAHTRLDIPCALPPSVGEKVQYRADDLPHGLRDHSICQYMLAMKHSIPKCPQDKEIYAYYSSRAVSK